MPPEIARGQSSPDRPADWPRSLKLAISDGETDWEVLVTVEDATATVNDLLVSLGLIGSALKVDGIRFEGPRRLVETSLGNGSAVCLDDRPAVRIPDTHVATLDRVGGLRSGEKVDLRSGLTALHRNGNATSRAASLDDPASGAVVLHVSESGDIEVRPGNQAAVIGQAFLIQPTPLGSDVLNLGSDRFINRQARQASPRDVAKPGTVTVPAFETTEPSEVDQQDPSVDREPFGVYTAVSTAPLTLLGVVHPVLALAGAIGPLVALGQWLDQRPRSESGPHAPADARHRSLLQAFANDVRAERDREQLRRWQQHFGPSELADRVNGAEVNATPSDAAPTTPIPSGIVLSVAVGRDHVWRPDLSTSASNKADHRIEQVLANHSNLLSVPIQMDLLAQPLTVAGAAEDVNAVLRWIVLRVASGLGTDQRLTLRVPGESPGALDSWQWTAWLPGVDREVSGKDLSGDALAGEATSLWLGTQLLASAIAPPDEAPAVERQEPVASLTIDSDGLAVFTDSDATTDWPDLTPIGVTEDFAADLARSINRATPATSFVPKIETDELLGVKERPEDQLEQWSAQASAGSIEATIGASPTGEPVKVPLYQPVLLPESSGNLEAALVLSLAASYSPEDVEIILQPGETKGGLEDLPHVVSEINLDEPDSESSTRIAFRPTGDGRTLVELLGTAHGMSASLYNSAMNRTVITRNPDGQTYQLHRRGSLPKTFLPVVPGVSSHGPVRSQVLNGSRGEPWIAGRQHLIRAALQKQFDTELLPQDQSSAETAPDQELLPQESQERPTSLGAFDRF